LIEISARPAGNPAGRPQLRERTEELAQRMRERGVASMDSNFAKIADLLPRAAREMKAAEEELGRIEALGESIFTGDQAKQVTGVFPDLGLIAVHDVETASEAISTKESESPPSETKLSSTVASGRPSTVA
jgi:hypothetical protein